jgi:outer membrane protein TolC
VKQIRQIEVPQTCGPQVINATTSTAEPFSVRRTEPIEYWPLALQDTIQLALQNSDVIRDIGGRVIQTPLGTPSVYDVARQETDPRTGVEAALSAFDAQFATSLFMNRDERTLNNVFFGGGAVSLSSNTGNYRAELSKRAATGTQYFLRTLIDYDRNTAPANRFRSAYNVAMEAEFRHPLLQGSGLEFNRLAGPSGLPGVYNGVVIARIRTDIALADFEASIRGLVRDVELSYWQLYYAYRSLDARLSARASALTTWRKVQNRLEVGKAPPPDEALARDQYYLTEAAVEDALNGSTVLTGVYKSERQLRRLMGVTVNDGRLIRPADEPSTAEQIFDWSESVDLSLARRVELRRQRWTVKQRESELLASRNYLLSRVDLVGLYRWRGFGDNLLGDGDIPNGSAFGDLYSGDLQGWQVGLQYSVPLGQRLAHAAVRNAELTLARERALLRNQELHVTTEVSDAIAELDRAYAVTRSNYNRTLATRQYLNAAIALEDSGTKDLEFVVLAQTRAAEADTFYYRALVDYNLAVSNVHLARGTYLDYSGVQLSEGAWSAQSEQAYADRANRLRPAMNYCLTTPRAVSAGPYNQVPPTRAFDGSSGSAPDTPAEPTPSDAVPVQHELPPTGIGPIEPQESAMRLDRWPNR